MLITLLEKELDRNEYQLFESAKLGEKEIMSDLKIGISTLQSLGSTEKYWRMNYSLKKYYAYVLRVSNSYVED